MSILTLFSMNVLAESIAKESSNAGQLSTIYVTANKLLDVEKQNQTITREELNQSSAEDLASMLRYEAGVEVEQQSGLANGNFNIRGISEDRVLVMVDGLSLPDSFKDSFWYGGSNARAKNGMTFGQNLVEPDTIQEIRVVKGPFDALTSSDAIGGSVNMRTILPEDIILAEKNWGILQKNSVNSGNDGWATTTGVAGKTDNASGLIMYTHRDYHETETADQQANKQDNDSNNILAKGELKFAEHTLNGTVEQFKRKVNSNDLIVEGSSDLSHSERKRISAEYQYKPINTSAFSWLKIGLDHQELTSDLLQIESLARDKHLQEYQQKQNRAYIQGAWHFYALGQHHLISGVEFKETETSTDRHQEKYDASGVLSSIDDEIYYPANKKENWSFYVRDRWAFSNGLSLVPGLRYTHEKITPDASDFSRLKNQANKDLDEMIQKQSYDKWTPSLTLNQVLNENNQIVASYAMGFKTPQYDAQGAASHSVAGGMIQYYNVPNLNLKPETSDSFELGWIYADNQIKTELKAFYSRYKNFIDEAQTISTHSPAGRPSVNDPLVMELSSVNIGRVETYGAELSGQYQWTPALNLNASLFWMQSENKDDGSHLNTELPLKARLGVNYDQENWGVFAKWTVSGSKSDYAAANKSTPTTPGYGLMDLGGYWQVNQNARVNLNVHNIFDKKYWLANDTLWLETTGQMSDKDYYTQAGRAVSAALELKF